MLTRRSIILSIIALIFLILLALMLVSQGSLTWLGTRALVPPLSGTLVGGRLAGALLAGNHTLQFRGRTSDGQTVSDSVSFTATAPTAVCGDGALAATEECDDGNLVSGDGCSGSDHPNGPCFVEICGDRYVDRDGIPSSTGERIYEEQCDDGSTCVGGVKNGQACTSFGGALMEAQCPGGACIPQSFDGCQNNCLLEICGNATVEPGEQCDGGGACSLGGTYSCVTSAQADLCRQDGGTCTPQATATCTAACRTPVVVTGPACGNGVDDDGDGGADTPGSLSVVREEPTSEGLAWLARGMHSEGSKNYLWDSRGQKAYTIQQSLWDPVAPTRSGVITRYDISGAPRAEGSVEVAAPGQSMYSAQLNADGSRLYVMMDEDVEANNRPTTLVEITTATMKISRRLDILSPGSTAMFALFYLDEVRGKIFVVESYLVESSPKVTEVDLASFTKTRTVTLSSTKFNDAVYDASHGRLLISTALSTGSGETAKLISFSVDQFRETGVFTIHHGSIFTFEGVTYNRIYTRLMGVDPILQHAYVFAENASSSRTSRPYFIVYDISGATPQPVRTLTSVPTAGSGTGSATPWFFFDSVGHTVYLPPVLIQDQRWASIDLERETVTKKSNEEFFGAWQGGQLVGPDSTGRDMLIVTLRQRSASATDLEIGPSRYINLGDNSCTAATDTDEAS